MEKALKLSCIVGALKKSEFDKSDMQALADGCAGLPLSALDDEQTKKLQEVGVQCLSGSI